MMAAVKETNRMADELKESEARIKVDEQEPEEISHELT